MTDELARALLVELAALRSVVEELREAMPPLTPAQRAARMRERRKAAVTQPVTHEVTQSAPSVTQFPEGKVTQSRAAVTHEVTQSVTHAPPSSSSPLSPSPAPPSSLSSLSPPSPSAAPAQAALLPLADNPSPLAKYLALAFPRLALTPAKEARWREAFPRVDLLAQAKKAARWCEDNPTKAPRTDFARFLGSWFGRAEDDAAAGRPVSTRAEHQQHRVGDLTDELANAFAKPPDRRPDP